LDWPIFLERRRKNKTSQNSSREPRNIFSTVAEEREKKLHLAMASSKLGNYNITQNSGKEASLLKSKNEYF
jgi:hypothetical protein